VTGEASMAVGRGWMSFSSGSVTSDRDPYYRFGNQDGWQEAEEIWSMVLKS